jgi:DnaJ-class molecular chaperone
MYLNLNMSSNSKSLYDILGVSKSDSCTDIKKAYLKLARAHHPDKGGDPEQFKQILRASEILTDENKRRMYDEMGIIEGENGGAPEGFGGANPFGGGGFPFPFEFNLNNLFGGMFGGGGPGGGMPNKNNIRKGKKPAPAVQTIQISLEQFYVGHNFDIHINRSTFCPECDNSGAKVKQTCKQCHGRGIISQIMQMGPMAVHSTNPCGECGGKGENIIQKCDNCSGTGSISEKRALSVKVQPGTKSGETYIFPEVCSDHPAFEKPGDAHIVITEDNSDPAFKTFKRIGDNFQHLETTITLSLAESLIGCVYNIKNHPGYDEGLFIKIPAGSFKSDKYCLSGFGMPIPGNIGKYGDLYVNINVEITPMERSIFNNRAYDVLQPIFEDKVRVHECSDDSIHSDLYLEKGSS